MNSTILILKEQLKNFYLINRLAQFQLKISNHDNYLGLAWEIINPLVQIIVYWVVFGLGIRGNREIDHHIPFVIWMLVGISMWFFINQGILDGTKSIAAKYNQVAKMNFPLSTIPSYVLLSKFYGHIILVVLVMIICMFFGFYPSIYTLQLFIYIPFVYLFSLSVTLLTSTLGVLIRDVQMAVQSLLRILFYASPILWDVNGSILQKYLMFNPVYFIAESYRAAILYHRWFFIEHWQLALYNIAVVIIFFMLGSYFHMKFRHRFSDFL